MCCGGSSRRRQGAPRRVRRVNSDSFSAIAYSDCTEGPQPTFLHNVRSSDPREARRNANCRHWGPLSNIYE
ncbi:unnamed protein product [Fusarium langsethiae]|nr:unnamed protein product [Fusarium langsethiae]